MNSCNEGDTVCPRCGRSQQDIEVSPHHLKSGTVLQEKYLVGSVLGEGGFGITYIGLDLVLNMRVAIKEYYPSGIVNRNHTHSDKVTFGVGNKESVFEKDRRQFMEEARILAKFVDEPGIVGVRDLFPANNTAYIVMDYLEGVTLKHYLGQEGVMGIDRLLELMLPVMQSLECIHGQGLIHRDISPDNIMMLKNGTLKLLDFGAARDVSAGDEKSLSVMLKPGYAPEEQYRGKGQQGPWTDVYALSATIYKCITGITPEDSMERVFEDQLKRPSELGAAISEAQENALMRGMTLLREGRWQSIGELRLGLIGDLSEKREEAQAVSLMIPAPKNRKAEGNGFRTANADLKAANNSPESEPYEKDISAAGRDICEDFAMDKARGKARKTSKKCALAALAAAVIILAATAAAFLKMGGTDIEDAIVIAGKTYALSDSLVSISRLETADELEKLKELPEIGTILFSNSHFGRDDLSVLKELTSLKHLGFNSCTFDDNALESLAEMNWLNSLSISSCNLAADVMAPLAGLAGLAQLSFVECAFGDGALTSLSGLPELRNLQFSSCTLTDADLIPIGQLPILKTLHFNSCTGFTDISPLGNLSALTELKLVDGQVADLSPLAECTLIGTLDIEDSPVEDISVTENFPDLKYLNCNNTHVGNLTPLAGCLQLLSLKAENCEIEDITPLENLTDMFILNLAGNQIASIAPLENLTNLTTLSLNENRITSLAPLIGHTKLKYFTCDGNRLDSINGLDNCTLFEYLDLSGNQISDISILSKSYDTLKTLYLQNNKIADISPLEGFQTLLSLNLADNEIIDLSPLNRCDTLTALCVDDNQLTAIDLSGCPILCLFSAANNSITSFSLDMPAGAAFVLDLSNNKLSDLSGLPSRSDYAALSLYGNPVRDFSPIESLIGTSLTFSYSDDLDMTPIINSDLTTIFAIDIPLDRQEKLKLQFSGKTLKFATTEEADKIIDEKKASLLGTAAK